MSGHGIDGIHEKVHEHLPELHRIGDDLGKVRREILHETYLAGDALPLGAVLHHQLRGGIENGIHVGFHEMRPWRPREIQQALDQSIDAVDLVDDLEKDAPVLLFEIGLPGKDIHRQLDARKGVFYLVRQSGGQFAGGLEMLRPLKHLFRPLSFRHVPVNSEDIFVIVELKYPGADLNGEHRAVLFHVLYLGLYPFSLQQPFDPFE